MITRETKIDVCDNSGAQIVRCIGFFKNIKTHFVGINEVVVVCLKKFSRKKFYTTRIKKKGGQTAKKKSKLPSLQIKERLIYLGIIITTKKP
jgi:ribosomal protein L14